MEIYPVTYGLILANLIASLYAFSDRDFFERYLFWIDGIRRGRQYNRFITSGFLHGGMAHLLINMFVLWNFGEYLEVLLGKGGFLFVHMAGLLGGNIWTAFEKWDTPNYRAVGASGATSGIVLAFCLYNPFAQLYVFFIPMVAIVFAFAYIGISWFLSQREDTIIGHSAHLGGALAGVVATLIVDPGLVKAVMENFG